MERGRELAEETEYEREKAIQFCLLSFFDYIANCIAWRDLLFFKMFTDDDRRRLDAIHAPNDRTKQMLRKILETDKPRQLQQLVETLETKGYKKVVSILTGKKVPTNSEHRNLIALNGDLICQNMLPYDVLPELAAEDVIGQVDYERIRQKVQVAGNWEGTLELLFVLPNKHPDWFNIFIKTLLKNNHTELANVILGNNSAVASLDDTDSSRQDDDTVSVMSGHSGASAQTQSEGTQTYDEYDTYQSANKMLMNGGRVHVIRSANGVAPRNISAYYDTPRRANVTQSAVLRSTGITSGTNTLSIPYITAMLKSVQDEVAELKTLRKKDSFELEELKNRNLLQATLVRELCASMNGIRDRCQTGYMNKTLFDIKSWTN